MYKVSAKKNCWAFVGKKSLISENKSFNKIEHTTRLVAILHSCFFDVVAFLLLMLAVNVRYLVNTRLTPLSVFMVAS